MKTIDSRRLFDIRVVHRDITPGCLLVAEPFLREGYFNHAVIMLADYDRHAGAMGVVMNNLLTDTSLQELIPDVKRRDKVNVYCGGPVNSDRLFFIHTLGDIFPGAEQLADGLYIGGDFEAVTDYVNKGYPLDSTLRFFVGYSGWEAGQLEGECARNVWAVTPNILSPKEALTGADDAYWHKVVRRMGNPYAHWLLHPKNPSLN
ncbi:MAG: YqgE/AlgH family protein [Candidatus Amulumruptor caecigallinarius]|nr:YqgE/AlgH family protein [Candidatus Amulumruptor caecigallinarius]MCM1397325.1 YqgE/AlgH family protein [Candidatus Amulumruptor caecigallinarius]MCM1453611.1 YqgE/AlgH family protein [bacterium]